MTRLLQSDWKLASAERDDDVQVKIMQCEPYCKLKHATIDTPWFSWIISWAMPWPQLTWIGGIIIRSLMGSHIITHCYSDFDEKIIECQINNYSEYFPLGKNRLWWGSQESNYWEWFKLTLYLGDQRGISLRMHVEITLRSSMHVPHKP